MKEEYLINLKADLDAFNAVKDAIPDIERLNAIQLEKVIFYLKSLHSYYPNSENSSHFYADFTSKLDALKDSPRQLIYQKKVRSAIRRGMAGSVFSGLCLACSCAALLVSQTGTSIALLVVAFGFLLFVENRFFAQAIRISKFQDRDYFLQSLRTAKACNELDWAGLFSYNGVAKPGPQSDNDIERVAEEVGRLSSDLRNAIYNDEYFQYTSSQLDSSSATSIRR